ncbi:PAS domain-containing protein [Mycobacterium sp.]|uniref:PAS domain-containing protein n=1 Tax=Mycobacterium sp. TaxID=1785 RepID=UPI002D76A39C|nr:PAS domain-containing protein [Mycobacterium sp.]
MTDPAHLQLESHPAGSNACSIDARTDIETELSWVAEPTAYLVGANPAFVRALGYSKQELNYRPWLDFVHPADRERVRVILDSLLTSENPAQSESRFRCKDGTYRWIGWTAVARDGLFYATGRDFTARTTDADGHPAAPCEAWDCNVRLQAMLEQQAALRRVATLVAGGASPSQVFAAAVEEMANCMHVDSTAVVRYDSDNGAIVVSGRYQPALGKQSRVGERYSLDGDNVAARVWATGRAVRIENHETPARAEGAADVQLIPRSAVGAPIVVNGTLWGLAVAGSFGPEPLTADSEACLGDFANLLATAITNAAARAELLASRARIVAAGDDARRRFERDLHDGAQQRLISLALSLRMAEASVPRDQAGLKRSLARAVSDLSDISHEIREISHGLHPSILSHGGLGPALITLARRSAVPVALDVTVDHRLPDSAEVAAYYVVAEALTNAAKHAQASEVKISASADGDELRVAVSDDGVGGADSDKGSGLSGLIDRVEALGGRMRIDSPPGRGTSVQIAIPVGSNEADSVCG